MVSPHEAPKAQEIDPEKVKAVKQAATGLSGEIWRCVEEGVIVIKLTASDPRSQDVVNNLIMQMPQQLAVQFQSFLGITGKIKNKKSIFAKVE